MKCSVCDTEIREMVCPKCGFDESMNYGKYPTLGSVRNARPVSVLRRQWQEQQNPPKRAPLPPPPPEPPKKKKWLPLLIAAAFALTLGLGVWIGAGIGSSSEPSEPGESVQMQQPPETTKESDRVVNVIGPWTTNVLRSDKPSEIDYDDIKDYSVFGSEYRREQIKTVTFLDTLDDVPTDAWDVSEAGNGTVMAWVKPNGELFDLYIGGDGSIWAGESCDCLFGGYINVERITFGEVFHTEQAKSMESMFYRCHQLTELDLSGFDTGLVYNMRMMFYCCTNLSNLNMTGFDTHKVQDMAHMFGGCRNLTELDLRDFNTANVQDMSWMFTDCDSLEKLDLSGFDTSSVESMSWMFTGCKRLVELDLSSFHMDNVTGMYAMFDDCPAGADWQHLLH